MNLVIRVDASTRIGVGHLARCRTLAHQVLRTRGAKVQFICRMHPGHQIDSLRADDFKVSELPPPTAENQVKDPDIMAENYAQWLGCPQEQDADETLATLDPWPDWLVVDHYSLDISWEQRVRNHVGRILVIDDLANRNHDCDVLVDQNYTAETEARYRDRLPAHAQRLLGPRYALLRPEYVERRRERTAHRGGVDRVLVFFGGTDPDNLTGRSLEALSDPAFSDVALDAVVGPNNPHGKALAEQAKARPGITLHGPRPHLVDLMAAADLAIGAGGSTTWERCCLGLPSLVVSIAENQRAACEALAADGLIAYAGHWDTVTVDGLRKQIAQLTQDPERLRTLSVAASHTVDGAGTERVVRCLLEAA